MRNERSPLSSGLEPLVSVYGAPSTSVCGIARSGLAEQHAQRRPCRSPQRQTGPHDGLCARVVVVDCARQRAVIFEGPHGVLGQGVDGAASDQKSCGSCVRLALSGALTAAGRVRLRNRENSQAAGGKRALHRGSGSRRMPMRSTYSSTSPTRPTAVAASSAVGHIHGDAVGPRGF